MPHPPGTNTDAMLPPHYAAWMRELLPEAIPPEPLATCHDCAACEHPERPLPAGAVAFRPDVKCCSYEPDLANYLVGRVLADDDPAAAEGRATVERRLAAGAGVTPLGLATSPAYSAVYERHSRVLFGRTLSMRCPHYVDRDGGLCGIWKHRNSVCSTYFCLHDRGATGAAFWHDLKLLLGTADAVLALACVERLGLDVAALRALFPNPGIRPHVPVTPEAIDGRPDPERERAVWGEWLGREAAFYRACADVAAGVSWADLQRLGGVELAMRERVLQRAFADLTSRELPPLLRVAPHRRQALAGDETAVRLQADGRREWLDVPAALADALPRFDGRTPTGEVLLDVAIATRQAMPAWLVRRLVDRQLLVAPPPVAVPAAVVGAPTSAAAARALPLLGG